MDLLGGQKEDVYPFRGRLPNVTHYVHDVTFGAPFPPGNNPLQGTHNELDNGSGVALANVTVKLVQQRTSERFIRNGGHTKRV
mmetsp:Transcript_24172/g.41387  ORF Transcript_24172/g.41387 Transcript_24172/m.41387 type:complete len:83 (+) Transcript_24172:564-812(+)